MSTKGQGHSLTMVRSFIDLGPNLADSIFLNFFSSRQIEAKFHVDPPWDWGTKAFSNDAGHMTQDGYHAHIL